MQLCSKSWILILKHIWKNQLSMCIQNWSHSVARPPKFSRVNEVLVSSTQPLEITHIYLNDEVPCEGLEKLCSILCFLVICLFHWQAAMNVWAFPPGLQEEIHRDIHRKKPSWFGQDKALCNSQVCKNAGVTSLKCLSEVSTRNRVRVIIYYWS